VRHIRVDHMQNHHTRLRRFEWLDGSLWWRSCTPGGFDGYRTIRGRMLPCATMETALCVPGMRDEIRRLAARREG
jgi:hypothetical protein